jgi:hypothetical protein
MKGNNNYWVSGAHEHLEHGADEYSAHQPPGLNKPSEPKKAFTWYRRTF